MVIIALVSIILLVLSGISKAIKDTVQDHFYNSIFRKLNPAFWEKGGSWLNKYKDPASGDMTPKFWGSTTFLAWTTDAWHLFDTLQSTFWQLAVTIPFVYLMGWHWWLGIPVLILIKACVSLPFEVAYSKLFVRNEA